MKTRIFSLFAAMMLLFGAKAMAQTNGDVNEDGVVNEQDIEAVIKIMQEAGGVDGQYYYYVGQDPITADNYTTLAEVSNTLLKEKEYTTERFDYTYVLVPNSVTSIRVKELSIGAYWSDDSYQIDSTISIPGHVVYKTIGRCGASATILFEFDYTPVQHPTTSPLKGDINADGVVDVADIAAVIKIMTDNGSIETKYYYYIGMEEITADNYMTLAEARTTTLPARQYSKGKGKLYILVPDIVTSIKLKDFNAGAYVTEGGYSIDASISIPGHKVYVTRPSYSGSVIVEYCYE